LAEALHTLSDISVSGYLLIAVICPLARPDDVHMFGYGRAQNVAALAAATLFITFTNSTKKPFLASLGRRTVPIRACHSLYG
jgi:divalent metal cation (Fe/Co/Zn/Cd) transporter